MPPWMTRLLARLGLLSPDRLLIPFQKGSKRADARLLLLRPDGTTAEVPFRVDSGCTHTVLALSRAARHGLNISGPRKRIRLGTALSQEDAEVITVTYAIRLSASQRAAPFLIPVHLLVGQGSTRTPLLGLTGVIEQLRWVFDGRASRDAPEGHCLLEDVRPASARWPD